MIKTLYDGLYSYSPVHPIGGGGGGGGLPAKNNYKYQLYLSNTLATVTKYIY